MLKYQNRVGKNRQRLKHSLLKSTDAILNWLHDGKDILMHDTSRKSYQNDVRITRKRILRQVESNHSYFSETSPHVGFPCKIR